MMQIRLFTFDAITVSQNLKAQNIICTRQIQTLATELGPDPQTHDVFRDTCQLVCVCVVVH
jgi:hypothetical protein